MFYFNKIRSFVFQQSVEFINCKYKSDASVWRCLVTCDPEGGGTDLWSRYDTQRDYVESQQGEQSRIIDPKSGHRTVK